MISAHAGLSWNWGEITRSNNGHQNRREVSPGSTDLAWNPAATSTETGSAQARAEKITGLHADQLVNSAARRETPLTTRQTSATFLAQQMAQSEGMPQAEAGEPAAEGADAASKFLEYMSKTPEERYFEAFLQNKGLTQEEFEALPAAERADLMEEFEQELKARTVAEAAEQLNTQAASAASSSATPSVVTAELPGNTTADGDRREEG